MEIKYLFEGFGSERIWNPGNHLPKMEFDSNNKIEISLSIFVSGNKVCL
jgi:hypothetical protein